MKKTSDFSFADPVFTPLIGRRKRKKNPNKCRTKYCRGRVSKLTHSPWCPKCKTRRYKEKHPLKYSYYKLKFRALERGITFNLTFAQYEEFAISTGYASERGKTKFSLSIDRIEVDKGYEVGNLQVLTLSENTHKRNNHEYPRDKEENPF